MIAFVTGLGLERIDLFGFSIGGFVAQEMALVRPTLIRRLILAATAPKGAPGMHGWRDDIAAAARGESKPENLLYIMFAHSDTSQAKGREFLGRFLERADRDAPTSDAARDAEYDAVVEWGIPDHGAIQRLTGISAPTLVLQGDNDLMIPTKLRRTPPGVRLRSGGDHRALARQRSGATRPSPASRTYQGLSRARRAGRRPIVVTTTNPARGAPCSRLSSTRRPPRRRSSTSPV
jgi:pimeloyl-ACP methyl ester carboxylesterase